VCSKGRPITKASVEPPSAFPASPSPHPVLAPALSLFSFPPRSIRDTISHCGFSRAPNPRHHPSLSIMDTQVRLSMEDCAADGLAAMEKFF